MPLNNCPSAARVLSALAVVLAAAGLHVAVEGRPGDSLSGGSIDGHGPLQHGRALQQQAADNALLANAVTPQPTTVYRTWQGATKWVGR